MRRAYRKVICCKGWRGLICLADRTFFGLSDHLHEAHRRSADVNFIQAAYWRAT